MIFFLKGRLSSLDQFIDSMRSNLSLDSICIDCSSEDAMLLSLQKYDSLISSDSVIITFNNVGISVYVNNITYWQQRKVTFYNILVDHPFFYLDIINEFSFPKLFYVCIDSIHVEYLRYMFPNRESSFLFLPHGGTKVVNSIFNPRSIDILYVGNCKFPKDFDLSSDDELSNLFLQYAKEKYDSELCLEALTIIQDFCQDNAISCDSNLIASLSPLLIEFEENLACQRRIALIECLCKANLHVTVCGAGYWSILAEKYPPEIFDYKGFCSPQECIELISQSKISINVSPFFAGGAHERIFNSMLNGAVVVTNPSEYINSRFTNMEDLILWDEHDYTDIISSVSELLNNEDYRLSVAYNAFKKVSGDTWSSRANSLIDSK